MAHEAFVRILGARGSMPVSGREFLRYGGATTCILIRLAGQWLAVDAGTGLLKISEHLGEEPVRLSLLITHPHADHLLGLPFCPVLSRPGCQLDIYGAERQGMTVEDQCRVLFGPPLWPVGPEDMPSSPAFYDLPERMRIGEVTVERMEGVHPGGVSLLRLTGDGRSIVVATDCTVPEENAGSLAEFAADCDLLLCDGQYSREEWTSRAHFGHSTWEAAARLGRLCGAKRIRVIHHDPSHTDDRLEEAEKELGAVHPDCAFGREGEEVLL